MLSLKFITTRKIVKSPLLNEKQTSFEKIRKKKATIKRRRFTGIKLTK